MRKLSFVTVKSTPLKVSTKKWEHFKSDKDFSRMRSLYHFTICHLSAVIRFSYDSLLCHPCRWVVIGAQIRLYLLNNVQKSQAKPSSRLTFVFRNIVLLTSFPRQRFFSIFYSLADKGVQQHGKNVSTTHFASVAQKNQNFWKKKYIKSNKPGLKFWKHRNFSATTVYLRPLPSPPIRKMYPMSVSDYRVQNI